MVDYEIIFTVKTDLLEKFFFGAQVKEQVKFSQKKNLKNFGKFRKIFKKFFFEKNFQIFYSRGILRGWSKLSVSGLKMIAIKGRTKSQVLSKFPPLGGAREHF